MLQRQLIRFRQTGKRLLAGSWLPRTVQHGRGMQTGMKTDEFLNSGSAVYLESMLEHWRKDPNSVHSSWSSYFKDMHSDGGPSAIFEKDERVLQPGNSRTTALQLEKLEKAFNDHMSVQTLIRYYQEHGHKVADIDPLRQDQRITRYLPELDPAHYSLGKSELDTTFALPVTTCIGGSEKVLSLREIIRRLQNAYCGTVGVQYMFIPRRDQCDWIRSKFETPDAAKLTAADKKLILKRLIHAGAFEDFISKKWPNEKKFGLEGLESLIPALDAIIDTSRAAGVESFVMGMAHRGRLNVIANICQKPLEQLFAQFMHLKAADSGSGDVKYHLGLSQQFINDATNLPVKVTLCANPSHLETVDPVAQGKTKAEQFYMGDKKGEKVMSVLVHGDAAFPGQGVVYETFHLSALPEYSCHGTIHIVTNNQLGFTTNPLVARSSEYCTDLAQVVNAPVFHVNANDPEAVHYVAQVAALWRATFHKDVVIDLIGFRRNGHNELDEPRFTQPGMYKIIDQMDPVTVSYTKKLIDNGVIDAHYAAEETSKYIKRCAESYRTAQGITAVRHRDWLDSEWENWPPTSCQPFNTGVDEGILHRIGTVFSEIPKDFNIHQGTKRILENRQKLLQKRVADWAMGEALAFGSLLCEGIHVRLSGQDVERGTFSHRHHVLHDQERDKETYSPLANIRRGQAEYTVCNSSLSEYGVLGFELGFSITDPHALVLWEAQFGDFSNTAQPVIDQLISSGEDKWVRQAGIVLLLPHGYEGMGPEHSSARVERCLQLCSDDPYDMLLDCSREAVLTQLRNTNWQVMNLTTPANLFHALRRQVKLPFRKPLVIMTPKSLLRKPEAQSSFDEFLPSSEFKRIYPDKTASKHSDTIKRVVFCSGKLFYELDAERTKAGLEKDIALIRIEQICPFPHDLIKEQLKLYPSAQIVWAQEEHKNAGAWTYIQPRLDTLLGHGMNDERSVQYIGRAVSAATATGNKKRHESEQAKVIQEVMTWL
ncbi:2-oxoglutarate dehydrogenase, mitochondrial-like [Paramacrobiotus metropolitanus]|uniref:2-oxoglutarate dehydrogenase, mitochondrial-like n=1 Tax=Paramacrobiotus metropolitanus TaxID=2943436 RepID=UPI002445B291|nr:2-oxoglutarate dehydrogenase, mitochondrial-like [Paramacrobiotus metropolitanus]